MRSTLLIGLCLATTACALRPPSVVVRQGVQVSRVVLFQNGMAFFERRGAVSGGEIELTTRRDTVNDVLKSLTVVDQAGGQVSSVRVLPNAPTDTTVRVRVGLSGSNQHNVVINYIAPASGWRPTYRIMVEPNNRIRLQGFAIVDNRSGEGWQGINLGLSTELPISFAYDLGTPRFPTRPHFSSDGHLLVDLPTQTPETQPAHAIPHNAIQAGYAAANIRLPEFSNRAGRMVTTNEPSGSENTAPPQQQQPTQTRTSALEVAEQQSPEQAFLLDSPTAFTLGNDESGMVPFVDNSTAGEGVLLYKPATAGGASSRRMYRAVFFQNPLNAPLLTGPAAIYANGRFAGDAVTATIPQRAHAFIAYALEPSVEVSATRSSAEEEFRATALSGGFLTLEVTSIQRHEFSLRSSTPWRERTFVFAPNTSGFEPRNLPSGSVATDVGVYVPVEVTGNHATRRVDFVRRITPRIHIAAEPTHTYVSALLSMLEQRPEGSALAPRLRTLHTTIIRLREEQDRLERDIEVFRRAVSEHRESLDALRSVPANQALRQRIAARLAENVARSDEMTRRRVEASAEEVSARGQWFALLRELVVQPNSPRPAS